MNDEKIIKLFFDKRQLSYRLYKRYIIQEQNNEIISYLNKRFDDANDNYKETLLRIKWHIEKRPICPTCGRYTNFRGGNKDGKIYTTFCSSKCAQNDKNVQRLRYNTSVQKYGCGCNVKKYKQTCIEKYGVDNYRKTDECKEKIRNTTKKHYGVDNYGKLDYHIEKLRAKEICSKRDETKRKNGTLNTSKPEDESYVLLKRIFSDVERNYKSEKYPYKCDFYIPCIDLYIECNYHWSHGGHHFNSLNENDIAKLNVWKNKHTDYYDNAIYTWTVRDIDKYNCAIKNKLNYLEFWNIKELKKYIENYEQI